jgi:hypothetical protein
VVFALEKAVANRTTNVPTIARKIYPATVKLHWPIVVFFSDALMSDPFSIPAPLH